MREISSAGPKLKMSRRPINGSGLPIPRGSYSLMQRMDYLTNKTNNNTERNKWYILTHLGESCSCLQIPKLSDQLTQLLQIFRSMTQIFVKSTEMKTRIYPSACCSIYCTIEKCRFESPLLHCVFMEICLISIHFTLIWEHIYVHHVGYCRMYFHYIYKASININFLIKITVN